MYRVQGTEGVALIECINPTKDRWDLRADVQPYYNEVGEQQGVQYWEERYDHEPTDYDKEMFNNEVDKMMALELLGVEL